MKLAIIVKCDPKAPFSIAATQSCKAGRYSVTWINIGLKSRVFANRPGDLGSIPGRVIPKTLKMVLDTALLNTQNYKVRIKSEMEQSRERSSAHSLTSLW